MEPASDGLAADLDAVDLAHQEGQRLAAPAAAEEAEVAGCRGGDPAGDDSGPVGGEAKGSAGLVPGDPRDALGVEAFDPSVDGPAAAEQGGGDGGPGVPVAQEQEDVGAEADLGVGVLAVTGEQALTLLGTQFDAACHGCAEINVMADWLRLFLRLEALSCLAGAI